jgi:glutathione S-transferase
MLKIWGRLNSSNVQKVLWCCGELGLDYERINAGLQFGVNNTPEYRALNPNGLVPTIDEDGFVLWESHVIVRYLARKHSLGTLCPADPRACADADRWMDWMGATLWPALQPAFWNLIRVEPAKRDNTLVTDCLAKAGIVMARLETHLAGRRYVTGDTFTMGDIPLGVAVQRWLNLPFDRAPQPNVEAYYRQLQTRPAFKRWVDLLPLT